MEKGTVYIVARNGPGQAPEDLQRVLAALQGAVKVVSVQGAFCESRKMSVVSPAKWYSTRGRRVFGIRVVSDAGAVA